MKVRTHLIYLAVILGVIFLSYLFFSLQPPKIEKEVIVEHHTDTVTVVDTFTIEKPVPIYVKSKPDTVFLPSLDTTVVLDKETKIYEDSTYKAQISGFQPQLDLLEVYPKTIYVTETIVQEKVKNQRFGYGVQVGVGYGVFTHKPDLYIGFGIHYDF